LIKIYQGVDMPKTSPPIAKKTRIQSQNQQLILDAALDAFSTLGFRGTTVDQIAARCGLSKPNLLYYFRRKEDIYRAVLERTLVAWLAPLQILDIEADPISELERYISAKLEMTFANPAASRLFANEVLHGAPHIADFLNGPLRQLVNDKTRIIQSWVTQGRIAPVDPLHLLFAIWAVTQHYADFGTQVDALSPRPLTLDQTKSAVLNILLRGLKVSDKQ
jgi:TetR/AcrR family transcriptional regulator